ncbi:MAG TPA: hypothetical protein VIM14_11900 [Polyangia bacterium]
MKVDGRKVLAAGLAGMKQNALPGLALWILALLLVCADWLSPSAHAVFQSVGMWKSRYGLAFSATTTAFFGGAVPFLYLLGTHRIRRNHLAAEFAFYVLFWAYKGVEVDLFYRLQSYLFGDHATLGTIVRKVLVDQFIYNPISAAPMSALAFLWKESSFSFQAMKSKVGFYFLTFTVPVTLMSTWAVWIPAVAIIYCLPAPLQIPLFNLVLCFWVLVLSFISKRPTDS